MSLPVVKLRRDLRATRARLAMMVAAIAVSLTVFGAVLFAWSVVARETQRAYLGTAPASATIRFGPGVDAGRMAAIAAGARTLPGVIEATGRTQFASRVEVDGRARDISAQVFVAAPDDPMRMATFRVEQGGWPPAPGDILIRRDSLALLDVAVGDMMTVTTPGGGTARLRVAGTVYDPSLAPAAQVQVGQGYLSTASLAALGRPDVLDQLKIVVADPGRAAPSRDREVIVAVAGEVARWLRQAHGLAVWEIQVPEPLAHPHQGQADALLAALLIGAGVALLLATILVANMLNGLFTQQIPQIGIMKAIGAGSVRIGRLYLAMTLVVAGAATALALPPALWTAGVLAPNVFWFLGIQPESLAAAWWTYPVVLAAGLVLPALMALVPLVRTSRATVRAAIDHHGGAARPGAATGVLVGLGRVAGLDRGLLLALGNTVRRPARFVLSAGLLATAGMMFVAGMSARDSTEAVAEQATDRLRSDVMVQLADPVPVEALAPVVRQVPGVSRVEGWSVASAGVSGPGRVPLTRTYPDQSHGGVFVVAVPDGTAMLAPPRLLAGRWLHPRETDAVVLSQVTVADTLPGTGPGDTVELTIDGASTRWLVAGIAEERSDAFGAYVTAEGLAHAMGRPLWSDMLHIATDRHDELSRRTVADAVHAALVAAGVRVRTSESAGHQETATEGHLAPIVVILLATALPVGLVGCIGLASTMSANVLERTREFGVMHAIGARPKTVRRIVVAEGVLVALASCLLAVVPALGLTAAMDALLGNLFFHAPLPFQVSFLAIGVWTVLVVLGAMLASQTAAGHASRMTVREALTYL